MDMNSAVDAAHHQSQQQQQQQQVTDQQQQAVSNQQQQQQQQQNQQPPYTIPGILHYLQYEWHRFEVERQEWEVEKAELSARIALLQGEKKSHENLKHDLIRRIKMLEYCLRMERAKYHRLKHGTDPPFIESVTNQSGSQQLEGEHSTQQQLQKTTPTTAQQQQINDDSFINNNSSTITYGRELLRHYLQEIGYTDTIIDLRSNRVRSLLGIVDNNQPTSNQVQQQNSQPTNSNPNSNINSNSGSSSSNINSSGSSSTVGVGANSKTDNGSNNNKSNTSSNNDQVISNSSAPITAPTRYNIPESTKKSGESPFAPNILSNNAKSVKQQGADVGDAESSVLATFGFLYDNEAVKDSNQLEEEEEEISEDMIDAADRAASTSTTEYSYFDKECSEAKAMIKQKLDILNNGKSSNTCDSNAIENKKDSNRFSASNETAQSNMTSTTNAKGWCPSPQKNDVDIGELATLTALGSETNTDDHRKKQWTNKYRLQSHYDCVRALKFSEKDSLLVTASEDETIKLWHLSRPSLSSSKSRQPNLPPSINAISSLEGSIVDIEPLHTYRGHTSRILAINIYKNHIFSGAQNGEIIMWKIISDPNTADQYDKYDSSMLVCRFIGHNDAVWSLEIVDQPNSLEPLLCSASADLTIKIWNMSGENKEPLRTINIDSSPTCVVRIPLYNVSQTTADIAVSCCDGKIRLYDIATCLEQTESNTQPTAILECDDSHRINSIVIHPTLPYLASADSNRNIKFWDLKTQECKSTMVAHLDEVTSLACDPTGKYLLSASHDCSARLWLFEEKACIQEITSHRKKYDEGIFAVAFHPNLSHFATAGADGLAKVFV